MCVYNGTASKRSFKMAKMENVVVVIVVSSSSSSSGSGSSGSGSSGSGSGTRDGEPVVRPPDWTYDRGGRFSSRLTLVVARSVVEAHGPSARRTSFTI